MEVKNYFATDSQGNVLGSAQVYLYLAGTTTLATGVQNINGAALANPFTSQNNGLVQFKAPDNDYDLRVVKPGREFTIRIQCFDGVSFIRDFPEGLSYDGESLADSLNSNKSLPGYAELRAYTGSASVIHITNPGIEGFFEEVGSVSPIDNGGTLIVDAAGRSWARVFDGPSRVSWFEAGVGGDDVSLFSICAKSAKSAVNLTGYQATGNIPRADRCEVIVPAGQYSLGSLVDTGNRDVIWILDESSIVVGGTAYLNGEVRFSHRATRQGYGTSDYNCGQSITINGATYDEVAAITGLTNVSEIGNYTDRDSVGLFVRSGSVAPTIDAASASYTATTVTIPSPGADAVKRLRKGMIIDTKHATRWAAFLDSWSADGTVLTVKVGWFQLGGGGIASTPTNDAGLKVNASTKNWAINGSVSINPSGSCIGAAGLEMSIYNSRGDASSDLSNKENRVWGSDMSSLSTYKIQAGHMTRGPAVYGHVAWLSDTGFYYRGDGRAMLVEDSAGRQQLVVYNSGSMEIGSKDITDGVPRFLDFNFGLNNDFDVRFEASGGVSGTPGRGLAFIRAASLEITGSLISQTNGRFGTPSLAASRYIDFNTSGNSNTGDVRILATGGGVAAGQGTLTFQAVDVVTGGNFSPTSDITKTIGKLAARFVDAFVQRIRPGAGTVIWTSGTGTPEGSVTAAVGSMFTRTDGGASTTLYIKETGAGNTGWVAK